MRRPVPVLLLILTLSLAAPVTQAAPRPEPSATATFSGETTALGVSYSWARGVLHFQGRSRRFSATGVTLIGAGADRFDGEAEVYNLAEVEDFTGLYRVVGASGSFVTIGGGTAVLRNAKGVEIRLRGQNQGLQVGVAAGGVKLELR